jgi:hypothetical protein
MYYCSPHLFLELWNGVEIIISTSDVACESLHTRQLDGYDEFRNKQEQD